MVSPRWKGYNAFSVNMKKIFQYPNIPLSRTCLLYTSVFSHNLAHKCCKAAGIRSKARKRRYQRPGVEHVLFANEVKGRWNATRPLQLVVSDMTMFKVGNTYWERCV